MRPLAELQMALEQLRSIGCQFETIAIRIIELDLNSQIGNNVATSMLTMTDRTRIMLSHLVDTVQEAIQTVKDNTEER